MTRLLPALLVLMASAPVLAHPGHEHANATESFAHTPFWVVLSIVVVIAGFAAHKWVRSR